MEKKTIIIILLIILIVILVAMFATVSMSNNSSNYERVNLSSTCSLELTKDFHKMTDDTSISGTYGEYSSTTTGKYLTDGDTIIQYTKTTDNIGALATGGADMNGNLQFGNTKIYSRDVFNYETQETVHIQGTDKEKVDHIADSVQFSKGNATNSTKNPSQSNSNSKNTTNDPIVGYLGDGTPVHQSEYSKYASKQPVYTFDPSDPVQMSEMQDKMAEAERKMSDGGQSPSPQGGSSSSQSYEQTYSSDSGSGGGRGSDSSAYEVITATG